MERMFGVRYWDYSDQKFNFQGQICLSSTIVWGFLTLLLVEVVQRPIEQAVLLVDEKILTNITFVFTIVFTFDFASAFRTAIDLKDVLMRAERARKELERMQKRVEVLEAVVNDSVETMVEDIGERMNEQKLKVSELTEETMAELSVHLEMLRQRFEGSESMERVRKAIEASGVNEHMEDIQSEMKQMRARLEGLRLGVRTRLHPRQIRMLLRNPSARSLRYKEEWQFIKDKIRRGRDERRQ